MPPRLCTNRMRPVAGCVWMRASASGENLSVVLELRYEVDTKAHSASVATALLKRVSGATVWTPVRRNAEMAGSTHNPLAHGPYPVMVVLERFHTPRAPKDAVLIRNQEPGQAGIPDLRVHGA